MPPPLSRQLLFAFNSPTGLPYGTVGLRSRTATNPAWAKGASTVAEVASLQLEFRALSRHTSNPSYEAVAQRVMRHLRLMSRPTSLPPGLYPTFISPVNGEFVNADVTLGARADSLYEYLLKQWLFSGGTDARVRQMYDDSVASIAEHLVASGGQTRCNNCTFLRQWNHRTKVYSEKMDHLVCFVPGMLALGAHGDAAAEHLQLAEKLMHTCYRMYADQVTGLAAEISYVGEGEDGVLAVKQAKHNLLRPETVESLFVLWRVTGQEKYREWGWQIFQAFERHCRVSGGGYSSIKDVTMMPARHSGKMESFFTAETLKYLWLLFADTAFVPLDEWVFNTEAHPLRKHDAYQWGEEWGSLPDDEAEASGAGPDIEAVRARIRARAETLRVLAGKSRHLTG